jgi:hypothetical protein
MNEQIECRLCGKGYDDIEDFALVCDAVYRDDKDSEGLVLFICPECFKKHKARIMSMLTLDYLDIIIGHYDKYKTAIEKLTGDEHLVALIQNFKKRVLKDDNDEPLDGDEAVVLAAALLKLINLHQGIDDKEEYEEREESVN